MTASIVIVDYGAGNLRSVVNALRHLGYEPVVSDNPSEVARAGVLILPGVGAAAPAMEELKKRGLVESLCQHIFAEKPFLGVCLGLQLLFTITEEGGQNHCLGVVPGRVKKFAPGLKVPHMGWNQVKQKISHPVFAGIPDNSNFYFVHSYYGVPDSSTQIAGETEYGIPFCSVVAQGNLVATQFHPEKSGVMGLKIYQNFLKKALEGD
jgi:glutamine amidotransferase